MKLLILTQVVDSTDGALSFFHRWIEAFAARFEHIEVVCLTEGVHSLPAHVRVHSLGKETGRSRAKYIRRFYRYIWKLRNDYDAVFVHMNEEYVLLGAVLWRLMGKRVCLWRNYHKGTILTDIAALLSTKVFCTSRHSYTAKYKKTALMPVGVDTARFFPDARARRLPRSVLFLSGMWPSKRPEMLIDALAALTKEGIDFSADFYGSPLPEGQRYCASVKRHAISSGTADRVAFHTAVPHDATPDIYRTHAIFVNCSPSGMFDKTLFEAAASGCTVLSSSADFAAIAGADTYFDSVDTLAARLRSALCAPVLPLSAALLERHSLSVLADTLVREL